MREKLAEIAERRHQLRMQAAKQRNVITEQMRPLHKPMALVDRGLLIIGYFKKYPLLIAGATALISLTRPYRYTKWLRVGWLAFEWVRDIKRQSTDK